MRYATRSDFPEVLPDRNTAYCWYCHATSPEKQETERVSFTCRTCGKQADRVLIYDPLMSCSFDEESRLVHESCGIFITRGDGKLLLFQRRKYPYLLTIPAGHLEVDEPPEDCAKRETEEEVGFHPDKISLLFKGTIDGDSCMGGADIHYWQAYQHRYQGEGTITLDSEGSSWGWYDPSELNLENTIQPVCYILGQPGIKEKLASS